MHFLMYLPRREMLPSKNVYAKKVALKIIPKL